MNTEPTKSLTTSAELSFLYPYKGRGVWQGVENVSLRLSPLTFGRLDFLDDKGVSYRVRPDYLAVHVGPCAIAEAFEMLGDVMKEAVTSQPQHVSVIYVADGEEFRVEIPQVVAPPLITLDGILFLTLAQSGQPDSCILVSPDYFTIVTRPMETPCKN